jgi:hypothetical protein
MGGILFLILVGLYAALCLWLAKHLTKKIPDKSKRLAVATFAVVALLLLPGFDGILGYYNLQALCAAESKTQIFQKVPVPASILGVDGRPSEVDKYGNVNWDVVRPYLSTKATEAQIDKGVFKIHRITWSIYGVADGVEAARQTDFYYSGSSYLRTSGQGFGAAKCIAQPALDALFSEIVVPRPVR